MKPASMMTTSDSTKGDVALVEMHDAKIETLVLRMDQTCVVHFRHLPVYHERSAEDFAIWSYRASIELYGVDRFICEGGSPTSDYVSDAFAFDGDVAVEWTTLLKQKSVTRIEMTFGSGRKIDVSCHEARLTLEEPLKHFEDWRGPL